MNKRIKIYNIIFPIWLIFLMPPIIFLIIPSNFIIDSLVLLLAIKILKINKKGIYKNNILKVWGFGFLADIIAALFLLTVYFTNNENLIKAVTYNPYENMFAIIYIFIVLLIAGVLIYYFNYKFSFKKIKDKKKLSIIIALLTTPYIFLIPTSVFYNQGKKNIDKEITEFENDYKEFYIGDNSKTIGAFEKAVSIINAPIVLENEPYKINNYSLEVKIKKLIDKDSMNKIGLLLFNTSENMNELKFTTKNGDYIITKNRINEIYDKNDINQIIADNKKMTDDSFDEPFKYNDNYLIGIKKGIERNNYYDLGGTDEFTIIPKYEDVKIDIYEQTLNNDGTMSQRYIKSNNTSFSIKCNPSDLYSNVILKISYDNNVYEYSPYYSLKDGKLNMKDFILKIKEF